MSEPAPPELERPSWVDRIRPVRAFELLEKYRQRMVHAETGLPFAPRPGDRQLSIERLAFETGATLRLALSVFFPACVLLFAASFGWDFHGLVRACAVGGMIGFGTNWVAIKMLFWPRENRPIFGHGLIPSQRDQLIDKVANEVLENLINEELIVRRIEELRIVERLSKATIQRLRQVMQDPEFKDDLRRMILTYVGDLTATPGFRERLVSRAEQHLEEFAGVRFKGWLVRKLREIWRAPIAEAVNREIEELDATLDEALQHADEVLERLPEALEARQEEIDRVLGTMLSGLVREVDVRAIVHEQLSTISVEQLEKGFREFSDDKLSFITLLGGIFGVIGGTVIVWPLPSIAVLLTLAGGLAVLDVLVYRLARR